MHATETRFAAGYVRSLLWERDTLRDYLGVQRFTLAGERKRCGYNWGYKFDSVTASPSGRFVALYERLGTKAVLLRDGELLRELNRSYYCADDYDYPICLFTLPDGREVIAHCPDEYCKIEIELLETGERLTSRDTKPFDFFHSRLAANPQGTRLLSAGWVWQPFDYVMFFDIPAVLARPQLLDELQNGQWRDANVDVSNAAWLGETQAVLYSVEDAEDLWEANNQALAEPRLLKSALAIYDVPRETYSLRPPAARIGTMHALDENHVLGLYEHPKIVRLSDGAIVQAWPHLQTGKQLSSIRVQELPPMAFDTQAKRFAVASVEEVSVLTFEASN